MVYIGFSGGLVFPFSHFAVRPFPPSQLDNWRTQLQLCIVGISGVVGIVGISGIVGIAGDVGGLEHCGEVKKIET